MSMQAQSGMLAQLRLGFKQVNRFMLLLWRLGLGRFLQSRWGGYIMVLNHIGRKTGRLRRTPVNYAIVDGELYCTAGFGRVSDWYRNLRAHPEVEVWLPGSRWAGIAVDITDSAPNALFLLRQVLIGSGFAAYAAGINPIKMSDAELAAATADYRLIHIQRTAPITGPGGPGDLAWAWPLAALALLALVWRRKR